MNWPYHKTIVAVCSFQKLRKAQSLSRSLKCLINETLWTFWFVYSSAWLLATNQWYSVFLIYHTWTNKSPEPLFCLTAVCPDGLLLPHILNQILIVNCNSCIYSCMSLENILYFHEQRHTTVKWTWYDIIWQQINLYISSESSPPSIIVSVNISFI